MCGIAGLININQSAQLFEKQTMHDVHKAIKIQAHRGPDDTGVCAFNFRTQKSYAAINAMDIYLEKQIDGVIGFNRLSIKDFKIFCTKVLYLIIQE